MTGSSSLDQVAYRLDKWKKHLIDLTRRNKLLNYRPTKRTTVEIVDELPQQVLRQLLEGESFEFDPKSAAAQNDSADKPESGAEDSDSSDSDKVFGPGKTFQMGRSVEQSSRAEETDQNPEGDAETIERSLETGQDLSSTGEDLAEHHKDTRLQTPYTEDRLEKNLTAIYRKAKSSIEEQGVNTLFLALGMLEWYEDRSSDEMSKALLLLVPVTLSRETAASPFQLKLRDEEPVLNPALVERLKRDFSIKLPELSDLTADLDIDEIFEKIRNSVSGFERWRLTSDVALGCFSFQKFVLYRDIERHGDLFKKHPLIQALCGESEGGRIGLPEEIEQADLDERMSPWETVQILDADSSQQRAMLAVREGHDLVIEGPPGTGKSQTISNIIADQMAEGQKVLFVSEKMAALEVVKSRLDETGLGAFCLELHSNKTAKTEFVRELREALDFRAERAADYGDELERLRETAEDLRTYVSALHKPAAGLNWSPFEAIAQLTTVEDQPRVPADLPGLKDTSERGFLAACEDLDRLASAIDRIGSPDEHPLRGFGLRRASRTERADVEDASRRAREEIQKLLECAREAADYFGFSSPETVGDVELVLEGARVLTDSPGAEKSVLENPRWNEVSSEVEDLLEVGGEYSEQLDEVKRRFQPDVLDQDLSDDIAAYESYLRSGFWRFFKPGYWQLRSRLRSYLLEGHKPEDAEGFLDDLRTVKRCRENRIYLRDRDDLGRDLFGARWSGPASDWSELEEFARWVVQLRQYAIQEVLEEKGIERAASADVEEAEAQEIRMDLEEALDALRNSIQALLDTGEIDPEGSELGLTKGRKLQVLRDRTEEIDANLDRLRDYSAFRDAREECRHGIAGPYVQLALEEGLAPEALVPAFQRRFLEKWVDRVFDDRPVLDRFRSESHEKRIDRFRELDEKSKRAARQRTRNQLAESRRSILDADLEGQLQRVQREARKQRNIMPIRKLLKRAPEVIQHLKPCFMMSPLSVGKYLDPEVYDFDLLVFDEASQIPPADAVGAMLRADQTVVVGDQKQLPPTQFFGIELDNPGEIDDSDLELLEDMESVLDEAAVSGVPSVRLKWHYRSEHESLIRFSNEEFYQDDPLYTFPHAFKESPELGLQFEYLEDAVYEGGGVNPIEARRVADAVVEHIRTNGKLSLGVGTFGMSQQRKIQDELDQRRKKHPEIEWFFSQTGEEKFFVKNLENIQGDDRDVIFLSVTYGPDENGKVRRNFGPINRDGGWRRLNVITTRAKRRLRVFSSMKAEQIDPRGIKRSAQLLRKYLKYAETGSYPSSNLEMGPLESPFERSVKQAIEKLDYEVATQVGESGYRIDLAVVDPDRPGRFLCGIECDGATYHSAATVRDRDRIRQQVLGDRGWEIHRVWSTDWFHSREAQVERLERLIEASRDRTREGKETEGGEGVNPGPVSSPPFDKATGARPDGEANEATRSGSDGKDEPPGLDGGDKTPLSAIPVDEYQVGSPSRQGDSDEFYEVSIWSIKKVVREVVATEGPISEEMLARRVAGAWDLSRLGSRIRERIRKAVAGLASSGQINRSDGFVWPAELDKPPVRSRDVDGMNFKAEDVPPIEAVQAVRRLLRYRAPLLPDQIISEAARLLGFGRTGKQLRRVIRDAVEKLRNSGELEAGGYGMRLAEAPKADATAGADEDDSPAADPDPEPSLASAEKTDTREEPSRTRDGSGQFDVPAEDANPSVLLDWLFSFEAKVWFSLSRWLKENDELRGKERAFAYNMGQKVANSASASEAQAKYARDVFEHAVENGFDSSAVSGR